MNRRVSRECPSITARASWRTTLRTRSRRSGVANHLQAPAAHAAQPWAAGAWRWFATPDRRLLVLSVVLQLALAVMLGHSRDTRLFMATGYLVGTGHSPYVPLDLTAVFHHVGFKAISVVGYPPPWPLVTGLVYRSTYALGHNLIVYNLSLIHISEPTRLGMISYAVFC